MAEIVSETSPIRYLLCGKSPGHLEACTTISKPEFEVYRTATSVSEAKSVMSELLSNSSDPQISLIVMGGGFSQQDFEEARAAPAADSVLWLRPIQTSSGYDGPPPQGYPPAEQVAARVRKALEKYEGDLRAGKGKGETWYF